MSERKTDRRAFLETVGRGSLGILAAGVMAGRALGAEPARPGAGWVKKFDRKIKVGIVGYGVCKFGAAFGFQDHPNVEVVAVSDLFPDRRDGLAKACRCGKTYDSLEEMVKDDQIEAIFVATDAPNHAKHCIDVVNHGKHVMCAVPAVFGSLEQAEQLVEAVKKSGKKYMMAETSCYRADCYAMRVLYQAGVLGKIVFSEGEYYHHVNKPIDSYKQWRVGLPPLWYPTHSTAYYVGVTGKRLTSVSCQGFKGTWDIYKAGGNRYENPFADEIGLFQTSEGGSSRMLMAHSVGGLIQEVGRVFGEKGWYDATGYHGKEKNLPDVTRPALPPGMPGGGHGGSHGLLTNEFVHAILEDRSPLVNVYEALAMTVPGIIAHQSALKDGELFKVPSFDPKPA